jgi:protein-tyrosine-phosphatase
MAEAIYHSLVSEEYIEVVSRGLVVLFEEPVNPKAVLVAQNHQLAMEEHRSSALSHEEITPETLILTMSEKQKQTVLEDYPEAEYVYTLNEFTGEIKEVLDPYGEGLLEYEELYIALARMVKKAVIRLHGAEQQYILERRTRLLLQR